MRITFKDRCDSRFNVAKLLVHSLTIFLNIADKIALATVLLLLDIQNRASQSCRGGILFIFLKKFPKSQDVVEHWT
jgi:putative flippase GtrA